MDNPITLFQEWLTEAKKSKLAEPTAFVLATANKELAPSARVLLLKRVDEHGFVFFTSRLSCKGRELAENPQAAMCFYWDPLFKQVRVEGKVTATSTEESDAYFATRKRERQLGAWSSSQSELLEDYDLLEARFKEQSQKYKDTDIPRPTHWGGYRLVPHSIEFWERGSHRLHKRRLFTRSDAGWKLTLLNP